MVWRFDSEPYQFNGTVRQWEYLDIFNREIAKTEVLDSVGTQLLPFYTLSKPFLLSLFIKYDHTKILNNFRFHEMLSFQLENIFYRSRYIFLHGDPKVEIQLCQFYSRETHFRINIYRNEEKWNNFRKGKVPNQTQTYIVPFNPFKLT